MNDFFLAEQSIGERIGYSAKEVNRVIGSRFIADNPPVPVQYYIKSLRGFTASEDYMDEILLHKKLPGMAPEEYAYAWADLCPPSAGTFHFRFRACGPVTIYVNGRRTFHTTLSQERLGEETSDICLDLEEGVNRLLFECVNTPLGCGFCIGSSSYKGRRIQFFSPGEKHRGMCGFLYSGPFREPLKSPEEAEYITWYPEIEWPETEREKNPVDRIFGHLADRYIIAAASVRFPSDGEYCFQGTAESDLTLMIDGKDLIQIEGKGRVFKKHSEIKKGNHLIAVKGGAFTLEIRDEAGNLLTMESPVPIKGGRSLSWFYAGPFRREDTVSLEEALSFQRPIRQGTGYTFWQVDLPDCFLRPFNEGTLYGEWNYPLGVTLYGMIQTARLLKSQDMDGYVEGHMKKCCGFYDYCMWDKSVYGAAPFHNQLTTIDSLDDCGSFASSLMEVMSDHAIEGGEKVTRTVADYIRNRQQRLPDGTFYRNHSYMALMNETMWADDTYMSVPFMCRYYKENGEDYWLEEAVRQIRQIFEYLYMPQEGIMSHIYDTRHGVQTKVPWGRGNGWVVFSLTELLAVMPEEHEDRKEILDIYRRLCRGILGLQDEEGMWHQVLTFPDSYRETSCTAMFVCGFARGVRFGWFGSAAENEEEAENKAKEGRHRDYGSLRFEKAALKGWKALCRTSIDWKGNIYGVCRGSGYSFSKEYYAKELPWNFNDTHGTGIVLLAGIEVEKMEEGVL